MLLIYPPLAKPGEMPPGVLKLAGALKHHGIEAVVMDANMEGLRYLLNLPQKASDTWTRRAVGRIEDNLSALRTGATYTSIDRYKRAVMDLNRVLAMAPAGKGIQLSLANYQNENLSPVRSADLANAFENPESSPFYGWFSRRLPEVLSEHTPEHVGFSLTYLSQALTTFAMIGFLKKNAPRLKIVLGGGLATSWARKPGWENPFSGMVDTLIAGPGEKPLLRLLGVEEPAAYYPTDYDALSPEPYLSPGFVLPYSASNGCYWNRCGFCPERAEGNPYIPVPPEKAVAELSTLIERKRPSLIHLLDNAISPALFNTIAQKMPPSPWYGFCRVEKTLTDPDFCMALKRSGCVMLKLGLESGDPAVLESMHKGVTIDTVTKVLGNLKRAGIATYIYLLFGTIGETQERARRTLSFTIRHADKIGFLNLAVFNLPENSPETASLPTDSFYEGDLSLYRNFRHPGGWDRPKVRSFLAREFKRHPAVAAILRRDPPLFTSNHAPFFVMKGSK